MIESCRRWDCDTYPFGFGGWIALTKGTGMDVMMGDLVLTENEVNPVDVRCP
jgi:hypothetical protein